MATVMVWPLTVKVPDLMAVAKLGEPREMVDGSPSPTTAWAETATPDWRGGGGQLLDGEIVIAGRSAGSDGGAGDDRIGTGGGAAIEKAGVGEGGDVGLEFA